MADECRTNTEKKSKDQDRSQQTASDGSLPPGWRPGRNPANIEINLRLRRSRRLQQVHEVEHSQDRLHAKEGPSFIAPAPEQQNHLEERPNVAVNRSEPSAQTSSITVEPRRRVRRPVPADWEPPLAIGDSLGDNLSRLEEAERSVLQWEAIVENARKTQPLADLAGLERQLDKVRLQLGEMEDTDENLTPVDELRSTQRQRVQERIELLRTSLEQSECLAGGINIRAAIQAYRTGQIKCWDKWTLLYAGHVADFCPSYESFTLDREERMDRYYSLYGEGWLWYEPPLAPRGNYQPEQLMAATWAQPSEHCGMLTGYQAFGWNIHMGFRRVKGFHSRMTQKMGNPDSKNSGKVLLYQTKIRQDKSEERGTCFVEDEDDDKAAPRVCFNMQLDSGATHPCLHNTDLDYIGIDRKTYPAQTHTPINTATTSAVARIYEMRVDVCRHNGESLVGDNPVYPDDRRELGGIVPVLVLIQSSDDQSGPLKEWLEEAMQYGDDVSEKSMAERYKGQRETRLSGMLPFQVCYFSGAPGSSTFWFGEDRRDVLGTDRMPGQRRWERHKKVQGFKRPEQLADLNRPTIIFEQQSSEGTRVVEVDSNDDPSMSFMTIDDGNRSSRIFFRTGEPPRKVRIKDSAKAGAQPKAPAPARVLRPRKRQKYSS
ncbi:hypothetical protein FHETE_6609 [Fusarium heterosporum]|uniref:Uncharacterized protein n=1 Tax=Fusarium heterosporum TaxID=42747 RepID=A0A8H5TBA7_FUSHE|nr:hypothetical protein FHETE_6609 [Fusarium heterosporum]